MPKSEENSPAKRRTQPHATPTPDRIVHGVSIDREWRLWTEVVPAMSGCDRLRRTAYFYRREAITWARHARLLTLLRPESAKGLALSYLASYRRAKGGAL
jgi:hypothetical protein